jgi:DNA modification methylase
MTGNNPTYSDGSGRVVYCGDALQVLRQLPSESVHCCVTSPPYWGLRQYLFDNAVVLRDDLTNEERLFVQQELERHGIKPKV